MANNKKETKGIIKEGYNPPPKIPKPKPPRPMPLPKVNDKE
jgi:hypothetical protein